ncbi:MAG: protein kinase [Candidatus Eisenbacteria bacterium]|uniref:Protein kinase n=1 Tax=Eiseniibacteriota bacterium TaxID=2212470 RepID=A0A948RXH1_UNCEI|nr:protein kinase [Candidatus Eisenbacteria bacterium]MBU1948531.1 protein kinase [Candidatus Eisenbacteria bacterium]MBU2690867.1 protein kinase [Candidatus Eisenbacteria bacterium]
MSRIGGRYTLGSRLGSGAMGDVYQAADASSGHTVAIKILKPDLIQRHPEMLERFRREGEALRDLNHPNIVTLLDVIEEGNRHYIVMEYVAGGDLAALLAASPEGMPIDRSLNLALDLADALTRAHRLNIIHRDLKPANVLLAEDGTPRLTDFGIAHFAGEESLTDEGAVVGTYAYLSPESCMGLPVDHRADIWSFGVLLFEMLIGRRPFAGDSPGALITGILNNPLPDIQKMRTDLSNDLIDLIYRMLDKNRDARIPSVRRVGAELETMIKGMNAAATSGPRSQERSEFTIPASEPTARLKHNLPHQAFPFIGREEELAELGALLTKHDHPLITLLGPGGMGKSRLALEAAGCHLNAFRNGTFFVELAALRDPAGIPSAIADATGFRFSERGTPQEQILNYLRNKQVLLIMDNFEHLLEGRELVTFILQSAPDVTVLATSRTRLNLNTETVLHLDPLHFPNWETPEDALQYSAVQLFMQSAQRVRTDFALQGEDLHYLARTCRLVEGIPLGILLAAAWVDTLSLEEIAGEIGRSFNILESERSDLPDRQRSMRAVFDYSWQLLTDEERDAFARMSLFRGGCTRMAAQAVTGIPLRTLMGLVNKSLLRRDAASGRFHIHEMLRRYAGERLEGLGDAADVSDAHAAYYLKAVAGREADIKGRDQLAALDDIRSDFENVRAAWQWAVERRNLVLLDASMHCLYQFCFFRRQYNGEELFERALETLTPDPGGDAGATRVRLLARREGLLSKGGEADPAAVEEALESARRFGDPHEIAFCTLTMARALMNRLQLETAIGKFQDALELYDKIGDDFYRGLINHYIGFCRSHLGLSNLETGKKAYDLLYKAGDKIVLATVIGNLGEACLDRGDIDAARRYKEEAIGLARETNNLGPLAWNLVRLAAIELQDGDPERGREFAEEAQLYARESNDPIAIGSSQIAMGYMAAINADYAAALPMLEEAVHHMRSNPAGQGSATVALAACLCGAGRHEEAGARLKDLFSGALTAGVREDIVWALVPATLVMASRGKLNNAAEHMGMLSIHPRRPKGWLAADPQVIRLRADLEAALGKAGYAAAMKRGEGLEFEAVVRELAGELGGEISGQH